MNKKHRLISAFLAVLVIANTLSFPMSAGALALDTSSGLGYEKAELSSHNEAGGTYGQFTYSVTDSEVAITGCDPSASEAVIPETIEDLPVTSIGYDAFSDCTEILSVVIPKSVTEVRDIAFRGCTSLTSVTFLGDAPAIGDNAFHFKVVTAYYDPSCNGWTEDVLGNYGGNITWSSLCEHTWSETLSHDDAQHYYECTKCGSKKDAADHVFEGEIDIECDTCGYTMPDEMLWIFDETTGTLTVKHNGVMVNYPSFENTPWYSLADKIKTVVIADGVKRVGEKSFAGCDSIEQVKLSSSVTSIGMGAFEGCSGLAEVHIGDLAAWCGISFEAIESNPLYYAGDLYLNRSLVDDLVIPAGVTKIGAYAFINSQSIKSIKIADSVTEIGDGAFAYCANLTELRIPAGVTVIGEAAFAACTELDSIEVDENNAAYSSVGNCLIEIDTKTLIAGFGSSVIPNDGSVTQIGTGAFLYCMELTEIAIPEGVTSIGAYAFAGCRGLKSISIPDSVSEIGVEAFALCNITVTFAGGAPAIAASAFEDAVATIYYNPSRKGWTESAGEQYGGELTWVETEPDWNFDEATGTLYINDDAAMEDYASYRDVPWYLHTGKITNVVIKNGVTKIGGYAFYSCKSLEEITIPEGVESVGSYAFCECVLLESIDLPDSLSSFGSAAFEYCTGLKSVHIPASVTEMGEGAFSGCDKLDEVLYGGTEEQWNALQNKPECDNVTFGYVELTYIAGDLNGDESINTLDALMLARYLNGWTITITSTEAMDVNKDGNVNTLDGLILMRYLNGWDVKIG